jgi:hypothetical protein
MGLSSIIANAVATAKAVTLDLQPTVSLQQWIGQSQEGDPDYATAVNYRVILNYERKAIKLPDGTETSSRAYLAFLEPVAPATANVGQTRANPIDKRDVITLPDGSTGPILTVSGFANGVTGVPYFSEIFLGEAEQSR